MIKKLFIALMLLVLYNCAEIIEVEDISEEQVVILAPTDNLTVDILDINFSWEPIELAESYQLQIAYPDFDAAQEIVLDTIISETNYTESLDPNSYQWRVRAINFGYETLYTTQTLTIED